jgi:hypothetical protein
VVAHHPDKPWIADKCAELHELLGCESEPEPEAEPAKKLLRAA